MKEILGNTAIFIILYIVFMVPTYVLPYFGSNSPLVNAVGVSSGLGMNPASWVHLLALVVFVAAVQFCYYYQNKELCTANKN